MNIHTKESNAKINFYDFVDESRSFNDDAKVSVKKRIENINLNNRIVEYELNDYEKISQNISSDININSKIKKTKEIFEVIKQILMFDLENENKEIFENLCHFINHEGFIKGHNLALKKRKKRIENEYNNKLNKYAIELNQHSEKIKKYKSKDFFGKLFSTEMLTPPIKPLKKY
mgnify:CR=1 FL=1